MTIVRVLAVVISLLAGVGGAHAQTPLTMGDLFAVDSKVMGEQRRVIVWTPADYAVGTVEFLSRNGRMPPTIVVGLFNTDRTRDLTPYKDKDDDTQLPTAGGADRFLTTRSKRSLTAGACCARATARSRAAGRRSRLTTRSSRLGWTITPPEATVNALGYAALGERRFDCSTRSAYAATPLERSWQIAGDAYGVGRRLPST